MKEQPQKRERPTHFAVQRNGYTTIAVFSYSDAVEYFDHLEQENTALKERVAKLLERDQRDELITNDYIRDSIRASRARQLCQRILDRERPCPSAMQLARDVITWLDGSDK